MSTTEIMRVQYTPDGDTVRCWRNVLDEPTGRIIATEIRVRLAYIDAPELGSDHYSRAWGLSARRYLRRLLALHEPVRVTIYGQDYYGRLLGEILRARDDANCGLRLVLGGYAALWQCPLSREDYYAAQAIAQRQRRGIWSQPGPWQTPWAYR
ncbi:MAG: thermonuclease family protein [Candidatus Competibacteraceae bacterium]|nr:thermonuclease family protein [Candidatus Competibacteraceae bacterium]